MTTRLRWHESTMTPPPAAVAGKLLGCSEDDAASKARIYDDLDEVDGAALEARVDVDSGL